jgi:hypothetical protein
MVLASSLLIVLVMPFAAHADKVKADRSGLWLGSWQVPVGAVTGLEMSNDHYDGYPVIDLALSDEGAAQFADLTRRGLGRPLPISVDGAVISAPVVREPITGGSVRISGFGSRKEAEAIAARLTQALQLPMRAD